MLCKNFLNKFVKKWREKNGNWHQRLSYYVCFLGQAKKGHGGQEAKPMSSSTWNMSRKVRLTVLSRNCNKQNITVLPFRAYTRVECKCKLFSSFHWSFPGTHPQKNHAMTTCRYLYYSPLHWYSHEPIYSLNAITKHVLYLWFNTL